MALQFTHLHLGILVPDCYARIASFAGSKESLQFTLEYKSSHDQPAYTSSSFFCDLGLDGPNPIKQAYEHLKTLPEFEGAEDC